MRVTLTDAELMFAAQVGAQRQIDSMRERRATRFVPTDWWGADINGACGELAVAKALDCFWSGGYFRSRDVGEYQVRTTPYRTGHLTLHADDKDDHIFILVTGDGSTSEFRIAGWSVARDAKRPEFWRQGNSGVFDFWVPQAVLKPFEILRVRHSRKAPDVFAQGR